MITLLSLNRYVTLTKFEIETECSVLEVIRKRDFMFSIGFKDAYFHLPIIRLSTLSLDCTQRQGLPIQICVLAVL